MTPSDKWAQALENLATLSPRVIVFVVTMAGCPAHSRVRGLPGHRRGAPLDRASRARSWLLDLPPHTGMSAHAHLHARGQGGHGGHGHHQRTDRNRKPIGWRQVMNDAPPA